MRNIFHRSSEFVAKHKHHHHLFLAVLTLAVAGTGAYTFRQEIARAATYTFTQASWADVSSPDTVSTASHASNQTGWTKYYSQSGLTVGSNISLPSTGYSFMDDTATSTDSPNASGGGFAAGNFGTPATTALNGGSVQLAPPFSVTTTGNPTHTTSGGYEIYKYTGSGTFEVTAGTSNIEYLVVAGGGGGGGDYWDSYNQLYWGGGGGGAGGVLTGTLTSVGVGAYTVTVGGGGTGGSVSGDVYSGGTAGTAGVSGSDSVFSTITAHGGGGGGAGGTSGISGGSGGGRGRGVSLSSGSGISGEGFSGTVSGNYAGGGGGATAVGTPNSGTTAGSGGAGVASSISGASVTYAGGGGGGGSRASSGTIQAAGGAGAGGGGAGGSGAGTANTGGGGGGKTYGGGAGATGGAGGSGVVIVRYLTPAAYVSSGTFVSNTIDFARATIFTNMVVASTTPSGTSVSMKVRSSADGSTWADWDTGGCTATTAGEFTMSSLGCVTDGDRYIQYQATLSGDTTVTPTLDSVTINDTQFSTGAGTLISSKYDAGDDTNLISKLSWVETATSTNETIKFQVRSASSAAGLDSATWCGPTVCDDNEKFEYTNNGVTLASNHPLRSDGNDRWVQYKVFLASAGAVTPFLTSVAVQYVVNAAPTFDATYGTNGISVSQITDSGSADFGKVTISYRIRDIDTTTGTTNAGYVVPSFAYNTGAGWVNITTNLSSGATDAKAVEEVNYNTYTATWTASSTVTANTASAQVRVTLNDNEAANSIGTATSGNFTLDTTVPVISTATLDSSTGGSAVGTIDLTTTDTNTIQYRICNDNSFPSSDAQGNSCAWTTLASSPVSASPSWIPTGSPSDEVVYMQVRDLYNNITSRTIVAPAMPANFGYTDASNVGIEVYREFLSWSPFVATTSSTFGSYKVYHSTDGETYGPPLTTITDSAVNYYVHNITTATSSTHYYKVTAVNAEGSTSNFTGVQSDIPDGSGGLDVTAPYIPLAGIASPTVGNSSANITFSTYTDSSMVTGELATSTVFYGTYSGAVPGTCPASRVDTSSYVVNHSAYLTGLTSGTDYYYCVVAKDMTGNTSTASPATGGVFTTAAGPRITNVTEREITDISALIFWNTDTSSDSKVYYSTTVAGVNGSTPVTGSIITTAGTDGTYQHQIGLASLTAGQTYYFKVTSTDAGELTSTDNNNGQYYSFVTLRDTTPPTISGIATPVLSSESAVIIWQTDEPATSRVQWGTTDAYGRTTVTDSTKSIYHIVTLSSGTSDMSSVTQELTPSTTYHFKVRSDDVAGNISESTDQTLETPSSGDVTITYVTVRSTGDSTSDTTPPVISNVVVSDITPFGAVVKFNTDEDTDGFVKYGKDTTYGDAAGDEVWAKTHTIKLRGLTLGTDYHIKVTANDKAGNTGSSADQIFKTTFLSENLKDMANIENIEQFQKEIESAIESILPSLVPPFITKPIISDITESAAKISFRSNIRAFPVVVFAEDGVFDEAKENPYTGEVSDTTEKATSHELALTGLKGNTKYHIQARGFSLPKVIGKSADVTFITKASKIAGSIVERRKDSFTVVWTTEEPTSSIVEYKDLKRGITGRKTDDAKKTSHSMKIENLPSGTAYEVNLSGLTEQGNVAEAGSPLSVTTSTDTTPPTISGFKVDNALVPGRTDRIQTIVTWVTDEPSNSTAYYQEGAGTPGDTEELANKNEILDSYVTNHSVILPSLKPGTIYRLKVTSTDDSGNEGSFGPRTVITPKQTESITDIIFKNFEDSFKFLQKI